MAERKQTPDVLAEVLGSPAPESDLGLLPVGRISALPAPPPARRPAKPVTPKPQPPAPGPAWDYQVVSLQNAHGWRPRFINGQELPGWMNGPAIHDYVNLRSGEGWELVAVASGERMYGTSDLYQLFFRKAQG